MKRECVYVEGFLILNVHFHHSPCQTAEGITGKFYAKHDVMRKEDADENFVKMIEVESCKGPKDRSQHPVTQNQR